MFGAILIYFGFDLGWRGYGWISHAIVGAGFIAIMTVYTMFTDVRHLSALFESYFYMALLFELLFFLPGWLVGHGARMLFGGGEPHSLKFSTDV